MENKVFNKQLMLQIREHVINNPRDISMDLWGEPKRLMGIFPCGTVCCIAGHAIELSGGVVPKHASTPAVIARKLLGMNNQESEWLFHFHNILSKSAWLQNNPYRDLGIKINMFKPGTKEYAAVVAEAIDRCIERHRAEPAGEPSVSDVDQVIQQIESMV